MIFLDKKKLAMTYFPSRLPRKYLERNSVLRLCSGWEEVEPLRYNNQININLYGFTFIYLLFITKKIISRICEIAIFVLPNNWIESLNKNCLCCESLIYLKSFK